MGLAPLLEVRRLGRTRYEDAHALQEALVGARVDGHVSDTLLFTEHEPVVTLGRGSPPGDAAGSGLRVVEIERGGEATWHGPGQIVGYPIRLLPEGQRDLHAYLRDLEEVVIRALGDFGVVGGRVEGKTGVWVQGRKLCSIGVAVRRWVTWHGFALNVHADLSDFRRFKPCGLDPALMANLDEFADVPAGLAAVEQHLEARIREVFGYLTPA
ncbi:MAG: lipoyl(octanoyl) transferase LipB [Planctomycetes bacterium]|nr:lipoyl(octanoyl) transferase LipB [Planctomycetota bacterium]